MTPTGVMGSISCRLFHLTGAEAEERTAWLKEHPKWGPGRPWEPAIRQAGKEYDYTLAMPGPYPPPESALSRRLRQRS